MVTDYPKLFTEGKIGSLTIKNRAVMSPMGTNFADILGNATEQLIAYYTERARGGIGLIITEYVGVDDVDSIPTQHNFRMAQNYNIKEAEKLTSRVHQYDCKIFAQLHHGGATSKSLYTGNINLSPSGISMVPNGEKSREMTLEDIKRVQDKFVAAAVRCKKAGFDGVELHGAHSYLIAQFFSKYYNQRKDNYGGSVENRCRFVTEIISRIRQELKNFPISVRMCGDEFTDEPGFLTLGDGLEIAKVLEHAGIDVLNISNGSAWNSNANCDPYSYEPGWKQHIAKMYKASLNIPIIATNTIKSPEFAEKTLTEGICDFVGLGRSQFSDPEFINKAKAGRSDLIRQCIGCMVCRERLIRDDMPVICSVNSRLGREYQYSWQQLTYDGQGQHVVVVGSGPAGLECAHILAKRGFKVTLFEQNAILGGTMYTASLPPHKGILQSFIHTLSLELNALDVDIKLQTEATVEDVLKLNPVGIFLATGSEATIPTDVPGIEQAVLANDVIEGKVEVKGDVIIIGTGLTGLECAELVLSRGHKLTLVNRTLPWGKGMYAVIFTDIFNRIKSYNPKLYHTHMLKTVLSDGVELLNKESNQIQKISADTIILASGVHPNQTLYSKLQTYFDERKITIPVINLGDSNKIGRIVDSVRDGFDKAWNFSIESFEK